MDTKIDIESEKQTTLPTVSFKSDKFKRYINFWQYIKFQIVYFANHQSRNSKEMQYSHQNMEEYQFSKLLHGSARTSGEWTRNTLNCKIVGHKNIRDFTKP